MKKIFLLLPLFLLFAGLTAFSRLSSTVDPRAEQLFKKEFSSAENVVWSKKGDLLAASFTWADQQAIAYFNSDGELVGCLRGLFFSQLPLTVTRSFERNFKNAIILESIEITNDEGVSYRLVMEHKEKRHEIRLNSSGEILSNKKLKK
jgi:hypothetical protein